MRWKFSNPGQTAAPSHRLNYLTRPLHRWLWRSGTLPVRLNTLHSRWPLPYHRSALATGLKICVHGSPDPWALQELRDLSPRDLSPMRPDYTPHPTPHTPIHKVCSTQVRIAMAIHQSFAETYALALKEAEARYKAQLDAKDEQIAAFRQQNANMQEVVKLLAQRPITVDVKATAESKAMQGNDYSRTVNITGDVTSSTLNLGEISGQVSNQINQLPPPPSPNPTLKPC